MSYIIIIIIIYLLSIQHIPLHVRGKTKFLPVHIHYITNDYSLSMLFSVI